MMLLELARRLEEESQQCIDAAGQELNVYIHAAGNNNPPIDVNCSIYGRATGRQGLRYSSVPPFSGVVAPILAAVSSYRPAWIAPNIKTDRINIPSRNDTRITCGYSQGDD